MRAKFNAAPWVIIDLGGCISIGCADEGRGVIVARIENRVSKRPLDESDRANARLIAAAPELYQELVERFAQTRCGCGHPHCNRCRDDRETERVLALVDTKTVWTPTPHDGSPEVVP